MGLVATPPIAAQESSIEIVSDGWFPSVNLAAVRETLVLDGSVTTIRLRRAVRAAIALMNSELRAWKADQVQASGADSLDDVDEEAIDGENVKAGHYLRGVCAYVEANVLESMRGYDLTAEGVRRAEMLESRITEARRNGYWALQDIKGEPRTACELI